MQQQQFVTTNICSFSPQSSEAISLYVLEGHTVEKVAGEEKSFVISEFFCCVAERKARYQRNMHRARVWCDSSFFWHKLGLFRMQAYRRLSL